MITIGVCSWVLDTQGVSAIQRASELGFKAIELGVFSMEDYEEIRKPATQAAYVEAATKYDVKLVGIMVGIFSHIWGIHNKEHEETIRETLCNIIDIAAAMKIELLTCAIFDGIGDFGIHNAKEMARTSAMLGRACDYVGDRPVQIATENTLSIQENRELINQVNHPKMRVLVDCYNGIWSGAFNGAEMVRELHDVICHVAHAKDGSDNALIGQGDGDFIATAQALKDIDFDGYIISESNYKAEAESRATADLQTLKHIFKNET